MLFVGDDKMGVKKPVINTGDIVFTRSNTLIGWLIRKITNGYYEHVALVIGVESLDHGADYVLVAEAQWGGFVITKYPKDYIYYRCGLGRVFPSLDSGQREFIRSRTLQLLGKKYDFRALWKIFKMLIFKKDLEYDNVNKVICSEAVAVIYKGLGVQFVAKPIGLVTPADIERSDEVSFLNK